MNHITYVRTPSTLKFINGLLLDAKYNGKYTIIFCSVDASNPAI